MFPVLVRSSTNNDEHLAAEKPRELSNASRLLKNLKNHENWRHNVIDEMREPRFMSLCELSTTSHDDSELNLTSDGHLNRIKRSCSDQELPSIKSQTSVQKCVVIEERMTTFKQPGRKTFSTLFMANNATKDDSSTIILSGSKLDTSDKFDPRCLDPANFIDFNRRFSIQRPSVMTIGGDLNNSSFYSASSFAEHFYLDQRQFGECAVDEEPDQVAKEIGITSNHIKYVTIFASLYFWCFPFTGIPSIIFSRLSKKHFNAKEYEKAKSYLSRSELFLVLTFFFGFTFIAGFFLYLDFAYFKNSKFFS